MVAYLMTAFVTGFPILTPLLLWKYQHIATKDGTSADDEFPNEISAGLRFLYENYCDNCWFWEVLELLRKVI